jgi:crotonobetainyl-CoA:carnitine CoA-transferase CaiB-like acyl-CoA transferase
MRDPHIAARDMVVEVEHPVMGRIRTFGSPVKTTGELVSIRRPAPWLGQHSAEVLSDLGFDAASIERLFDAKVVHDRLRTRAKSVQS